MEGIPIKIGLEIHCQLTNLKSKLFCGCSADYRDSPPNAHICPICMGLPGSLPSPNGKAIEDGVAVAIALNAEISKRMVFFRKNYFYPDMPKNFQISQYDGGGGVPLARGGSLAIEGGKRIRIRRIQIEEDPAKLAYEGTIDDSAATLIDNNRAGIALLEIVTEPDMDDPREARAFLGKLRGILECLGVSNGELEGAMRCDANISLGGGTRVEIKNISSFKEVERALAFEITRQRQLLAREMKVRRETRHWDEVRRITVSLRAKEEEEDYRYFPEPDIVPIEISEDFIERVRKGLPELPDQRRERYIKQFGLQGHNAELISSDNALSKLFEECIRMGGDPIEVSNWLVGDLISFTRELGMELTDRRVSPRKIVELVNLIRSGSISIKIAKDVLMESLRTDESPEEIVKRRGLLKISDEALLQGVVEEVFMENEEAVKEAICDEDVVNFLIGQVMKRTKGKADPSLTYRIVKRNLERISQGGAPN
jgi:aspartyl-tRNA(Asn)/glutamyl-tRNA(Gln) amidotransferase subunit B